jgi:hypothetical protein
MLSQPLRGRLILETNTLSVRDKNCQHQIHVILLGMANTLVSQSTVVAPLGRLVTRLTNLPSLFCGRSSAFVLRRSRTIALDRIRDRILRDNPIVFPSFATSTVDLHVPIRGLSAACRLRIEQAAQTGLCAPKHGRAVKKPGCSRRHIWNPEATASASKPNAAAAHRERKKGKSLDKT